MHDYASYCKVASIRRGGPRVRATENPSILISMTRTRSEARRRAAHGHRDPDAQAGIATVAPDPPQSDPRVTHGSSAGSMGGMSTKRHAGNSPLDQDSAQQASPGAPQEVAHAANGEQPSTPRLPSFQPSPHAPPLQQTAPAGQSAASPIQCNQPSNANQPMQHYPGPPDRDVITRCLHA